jgi:hypothetical protein
MQFDALRTHDVDKLLLTIQNFFFFFFTEAMDCFSARCVIAELFFIMLHCCCFLLTVITYKFHIIIVIVGMTNRSEGKHSENATTGIPRPLFSTPSKPRQSHSLKDLRLDESDISALAATLVVGITTHFKLVSTFNYYPATTIHVIPEFTFVQACLNDNRF